MMADGTVMKGKTHKGKGWDSNSYTPAGRGKKEEVLKGKNTAGGIGEYLTPADRARANTVNKSGEYGGDMRFEITPEEMEEEMFEYGNRQVTADLYQQLRVASDGLERAQKQSKKAIEKARAEVSRINVSIMDLQTTHNENRQKRDQQGKGCCMGKETKVYPESEGRVSSLQAPKKNRNKSPAKKTTTVAINKKGKAKYFETDTAEPEVKHQRRNSKISSLSF